MIHVLFSASKNITSWLSVAIISMAENTNSKITLHIIDNGITNLDRKIIEDICVKYKHLSKPKWYFIDINKEFSGCASWTGGLDTWSRYLAPNLIKNIDKIIYLDSDIIFTGDIQRIWDIDLEGFPLAVVPEIFMGADYMTDKLKYYRDVLHFSQKNLSFSVSTIIFDLKKWRSEKYTEKLKQIGIKYGEEIAGAPDQYAMNMLFADNYKAIDTALVPTTFDVEWFESVQKDRFSEMQNQMVIRQFNILKPWSEYLINNRPMLHFELFWYYAQKTPFADYFKVKFMISMYEKLKK